MIDKIKADLIAKTYYESVYKFCLAKLNHNTHDAKDITQDVFLLFQLKADTLEDDNIKAWLFKTAFLKTKEYNRAQKRDVNNVTLEDYDIEDETSNICDILEKSNIFDNTDIDKLRDMVYERLTDKEKTLYRKHYVENKSHTQIAQELNTNRKNVSVMVSRLNKKLEVMEFLVLCSVGQLILKLFF